MREIKFRGKRISDGDWFIGNLITEVDGDFNITNVYIHVRLSHVDFSENSLTSKLCLHEVDPKTVGQYTGLKDKNDKEIYEGDIISGQFNAGTVIFKHGSYQVQWDINPYDCSYLLTYADEQEIIGNIYENPELLK